MDDPALDVCGIGMRGRPGRLRAAALIDGDVHEHRPGPHALDHRAGDELRSRPARDEHGPDHEIGGEHLVLDVLHHGIERVELRAELQIELVEARQRFIDHRHPGLDAHRHAGGVRPRNPAAEDDDLRRGHARHAAEQNAPAALLFLEITGADLDRHAPRHLAHGRQKRQPAAGVRHGLVGDADRARAHQALGLGLVGRKMQIGEQHLSFAQGRDLAGLRLLHLHDHVRRREDFVGRGCDARAGGAIGLVGEADAVAGARLDHDLLAVMDQFPNRARHQADPVLVRLDLLGDADPHGSTRSSGSSILARARSW